MPEYAEVRLMTEFADKILETRKVISIEKNRISKMKFALSEVVSFPCIVRIYSRGKESRINIESGDPHKGGLYGSYYKVNYGMTGSWKHVNERWSKHAMISFALSDGTFLEFVDPRRFGSIRELESGNMWGLNRGADPIKEYPEFKNFILLNQDLSLFNHRVLDVMLDQRAMNGIGNYLRSTILHEININPFQKFNTLNRDELVLLIKTTRDWCQKAYDLNGAHLSTWDNPDEKPTSLSDLIFYKKGICCLDRTGRTFWFDDKWKSKCPRQSAKTPGELKFSVLF